MYVSDILFATQASESASNANQSAESASQFANNASNSANSASQSATSAQTSANNASTSERNARQSAETAQDVLDSVQAEGNTQINRVQSEGNTQIGRVQAKGNEILNSLPDDFTEVQKELASLNGSLGDVKAEIQRNTDLILSYVKEILTSVSGQDELAKSRIAANYFKTRASRYASLEFGCRWPSWDESHLSEGTRTKNAVDMVAYPSTDETAARNDFDNYFYGMIVNGHVRADGEFVVDYFDSDAEFNRYTRDTYVLFPPMYFKYDFTGGGEEIDLCLSQKEGYAPVGPAIKPNGTVRDFIPIACYGASLNNGVPMSVSGADIAHHMSHNVNITTAAAKGSQYAMETVQEYEFLNMIFLVTFATRDTQSIMKGCTSYNMQHTLAAGETGVSRVIVTNAQAAKFKVGSIVSVGLPDDATKLDRNYAYMHNIVDRKPITQITDLGNGNSAIYIDTGGETINTTTACYISAMPWRSGATDGVLGTCGSPESNSSGKYPYKLFGVACAWGQYIVLSNVVYKITAGIGKMYVTYDTANIKTSAPTADYSEVAYTVSGIGGNNGYISVMGYDANHPFVRFPIERDATLTTGYADNTYGMNNNTETTNGVREVSVGGGLTSAANAGRFYVSVAGALSTTTWYIAARLSALGACGAAAA